MSLNSLGETQRLIDAFCDGALGPDDAVRLNDRLASDWEARRAYLAQMWVEAELYWLCVPLESETRRAPAWIATQPPNGGQSCEANAVSYGKRARLWLSLAATVLLASTASGWLAFQGANGRGPLAMLETPTAGQPSPAEDGVIASGGVARVTGTRDCLWGAGTGKVGFGATLFVGQQLNLRAGLAELTFDNGARIVLEGPSQFLVPREGSVTLIRGKISAAIPQVVEEFSVRTARLAIADPGTQFGLIVDADGGTQVHVFDGPIHARAMDEQNRELNQVELAANQAARLSPVSSRFTFVRSDEELFTRTLAPSVGPAEGLFALEEFDYPVGPLAWHNGGFGWAGPWADLDLDPTVEGPSTNAVGEGSLATGSMVARGNRAVQTGRWNRVRRALSTSLRGVFDAAGLVEDRNAVRLIGRDGASIYLSFLQRATEVGDMFYGFELNRGDGNLNRVLSIGHGAEGTAYGVTSNTNGYVDPDIDYGDDKVCTPLYEPLGNENVKAHLLVIRIDYGADDQDVVTVYRDPVSLLNELKCTATATLRGNFSFDRISLGNFNGVKGKIHEVDEIRVGTSFTAVTGRRSTTGMPLADCDDTQRKKTGFLWPNSSTDRLLAIKIKYAAAALSWGGDM